MNYESYINVHSNDINMAPVKFLITNTNILSLLQAFINGVDIFGATIPFVIVNQVARPNNIMYQQRL